MIICAVGQPLSGKDEIANYLMEKKGFKGISTGDIIREEMIKNNIPVEPRSNIRLFAEKSRKEHGNQYPANIAVKMITYGVNIVISGPRNMAEINFFRNMFGREFVLVAIMAPINIRYERAVKNLRGRKGDNISFEQFKKEEDIECAGNSSHELDRVIGSADRIISNVGSLQEFFEKIDLLLKTIK